MKKRIEINLSILFIIISIIVIGIMAYRMYKMNGEIQRLSEKNENSENIINHDKENNETEKDILEDNTVEELAKNTLDKYIKLRVYENSNIGPMPYILKELGLETEENIALLCRDINNSTEYIKSYTKYEDFKNAMLQYITEDYFLKNFSQYKNIDGYVAFCNCSASLMALEIENLKLTSKNAETYIFEVTFKDVEMYEHYLAGEQMTKDMYLYNENITFKYINNKLVISEF